VRAIDCVCGRSADTALCSDRMACTEAGSEEDAEDSGGVLGAVIAAAKPSRLCRTRP